MRDRQIQKFVGWVLAIALPNSMGRSLVGFRSWTQPTTGAIELGFVPGPNLQVTGDIRG